MKKDKKNWLQKRLRQPKSLFDITSKFIYAYNLKINIEDVGHWIMEKHSSLVAKENLIEYNWVTYAEGDMSVMPIPNTLGYMKDNCEEPMYTMIVHHAGCKCYDKHVWLYHKMNQKLLNTMNRKRKWHDRIFEKCRDR